MTPRFAIAFLAALCWATFLASALIWGEVQGQAWLAATLLTCMANVWPYAATPPGATAGVPLCRSCGVARSAEFAFCIGCGAVPRRA